MKTLCAKQSVILCIACALSLTGGRDTYGTINSPLCLTCWLDRDKCAECGALVSWAQNRNDVTAAIEWRAGAPGSGPTAWGDKCYCALCAPVVMSRPFTHTVLLFKDHDKGGRHTASVRDTGR